MYQKKMNIRIKVLKIIKRMKYLFREFKRKGRKRKRDIKLKEDSKLIRFTFSEFKFIAARSSLVYMYYTS